jgi:hypothetical protein
MWCSENLDGLNGAGWGVFIALTTIPAVAVDGHTGQSGGAPDMALFIVRWVPRQPTIGVWSGWPLMSFVLLWHRTVQWHTGQSSAFDFAVLTSALFTVPPVSAVDRWAQLIVAPLAHRTVQCTPDSPVNYSGVTLRKTKSVQFVRCLGLGTGQCLVCHWLHLYLIVLQTL